MKYSLKSLKKLSILGVIVLVSFSFAGCTSQNSDDNTELSAVTQEETLPTRPSEISGLVRSIEGNEIIIANEIKDPALALTEEEKEAQRADRQSLSQEERQASRQEIAETLETESVTLSIPVGVPVMKSSGNADNTFVLADISEIKAGAYLSIWMNNDSVEAVKLKGTN